MHRTVWLTAEQAAAIRDFRFRHHLLSDMEAMRRLIALGLAAAAVQGAYERPFWPDGREATPNVIL